MNIIQRNEYSIAAAVAFPELYRPSLHKHNQNSTYIVQCASHTQWNILEGFCTRIQYTRHYSRTPTKSLSEFHGQ